MGTSNKNVQLRSSKKLFLLKVTFYQGYNQMVTCSSCVFQELQKNNTRKCFSSNVYPLDCL